MQWGVNKRKYRRQNNEVVEKEIKEDFGFDREQFGENLPK